MGVEAMRLANASLLISRDFNDLNTGVLMQHQQPQNRCLVQQTSTQVSSCLTTSKQVSCSTNLNTGVFMLKRSSWTKDFLSEARAVQPMLAAKSPILMPLKSAPQTQSQPQLPTP
jgi:hypothetical protein